MERGRSVLSATTSHKQLQTGEDTRRVMSLLGRLLSVVTGSFLMTAGPRRHRLATAAFREPSQLRAALSDLIREGLTSSDLCLVGAPSTVERIVAAGEPSIRAHETKRAFGDLVAFQLPNSVGQVVSSCATIFEWLVAAEARGRLSLLGAYKQQIAEGGAVLIVSSASTEQHDRASKALLRYSAGPISVDEFTQ